MCEYLTLDKYAGKNQLALFCLNNQAQKLPTAEQVGAKEMWSKIKGDDIIMLEIKPEQANKIKEELMPKDTNNFYSFRKDGKVVGYIMFAYQICGL